MVEADRHSALSALCFLCFFPIVKLTPTAVTSPPPPETLLLRGGRSRSGDARRASPGQRAAFRRGCRSVVAPRVSGVLRNAVLLALRRRGAALSAVRARRGQRRCSVQFHQRTCILRLQATVLRALSDVSSFPLRAANAKGGAGRAARARNAFPGLGLVLVYPEGEKGCVDDCDGLGGCTDGTWRSRAKKGCLRCWL